MTDHALAAPAERGTLTSYIYNPTARAIFFQVLTALLTVLFVLWIAGNTAENLARSGTASGYDFLNSRAGFDIGQSMIEYTSDSTYGRALVVGFLNTLLVAVTGIITATIIGFIIGIGRLSSNWLIARLCTVYVEVFRNIPVLLVIFFWYSGVLSTLPQVRESLDLPLGMFLNNRGLAVPKPIWGDGAVALPVAILIGIVAAIVVARWAKARQMATGQQFPTLWVSLGLIIGVPLIVFALVGWPLSFNYPELGRFNLAAERCSDRNSSRCISRFPSTLRPSSRKRSALASGACPRDRARHPRRSVSSPARPRVWSLFPRPCGSSFRL